MLIKEEISFWQKVAMSDIKIITATMKVSLQEIAKQAHALGIGLQNAAPGEKIGTSNPSIHYLLETSAHLNLLAEECEKLLVNMNESLTRPD
jgi:hypothetical protein